MALKFTTAALLLASGAVAVPSGGLGARQGNCPPVHVFGARETTVPPGMGSAGQVVNSIVQAHPGATSEAINYPAAGDNAYGSSVQQGTQAVADQVNSFAQRCPDTELVLVGYSQGAQIMDNAICGGGDPGQGWTNTDVLITGSVADQVKAVILMGDPRHTPGLPYNVGTSNAPGFDPRPSGFVCPAADKIQSYCDAADPYCSNGNNAQTHQSYGYVYGQQALDFVNEKLSD
ncbi:Acetylxylan esterase At 0.90 angstrom resolution [Lineolata rhizophorae]|uniref:Acetylxylan esterase At 0.90 angstrom resolution n=1 Tax=Lineolata rhizophorae TaxID=578093 RepID=A0A6A6P3V8_9PEZI|nr:Acetylxylan esterase At 0.90 angstrom resolution [Lineolata rhizophorae]